jgi:hypothetical protein
MRHAAALLVLLTAAPAAAADRPNACALLTSAEVEQVQASPVKEAKATSAPAKGMDQTRCFYRTEAFTSSVSLDLTRADAQAAARRWAGIARGDDGEEGEAPNEREREGKTRVEPQPVDGLGDAAVWVPSGGSGSLWVKKGGAILRLSVGGPDAPRAAVGKKDRAISLARKAVPRV